MINDIVPFWIENYTGPDDDNPDTLSAMNNLAITYGDLGQYQEALPLFEQVLAKSWAILGEDHPFTLMAMDNLAYIYEKLGRENEAAILREKIKEIRESK